MRKDPEDARCRLTALVELLRHDLAIEPALKFSNDGLIGLRCILQDCVTDLEDVPEETMTATPKSAR